jgi:flavin reductase (DIM6/NTAB) family NADH-FMN oxidoreductase RutF
MAPATLVSDVQPETFCETLSRFPSGLTVVTTKTAAGAVHGSTISAFSSLSLEPPLVLVALSRASDLLGHLQEQKRFGVNVLAVGQEQVGFACGGKGSDKLASVAWTEEDDLPRIDGAAAWVACDLHELLPGGDHLIVIGLVTRCDPGTDEPLVYHRRGFHRLRRRAA